MLFRKMLRDIRENLVSYAACIAIIGIGLLTYISMANVRDILLSAKQQYYRDYRFGDVFADVAGIPIAKLGALERIPGIRVVDAKLVRDVRVLMPGHDESVSLRLVSIDMRKEGRLNDIWLVDGSMVRTGTRTILLGVEFYDQNGFRPGDDITVVINGRKEVLTVSGKGQTPEFVYAMKNATDFLPSGETFGAAFLPFDAMESLFQMRGMVNSLSFALDPGFTFDDVREEIKTVLEPYSLKSLVPQKDQISNLMLSNEMAQLGNFATIAPMLFLGISSLILWIMLKRMVEHQRMQIGMLKAAGYTSWEVMRHYLSFALFVGVLGGLAGNIFGYLVSGYMTVMYTDFFTLPGLVNKFSWKYFIAGMALSILFSLLAGFLGARSVLRLSPAVALAPPAPHSGRRIPVERIRFFWNMLSVQGRMAMRNLFRSKGRSLFTLMGIALSYSLMASIFSFTDLFDVFILDQFRYVQRYDLKVMLAGPVASDDAVAELDRMKGVRMAEPLLEIPATLTHAHRSKSTVIIANAPAASLYTVVDNNNEILSIPDEGIILSQPLAKKLEAEVGDMLELDSPYQKNKDLKVPIAGIIPQYIGSNAFMNQDALNLLLGQGDIATSILLRVSADKMASLKETLLLGKTVSGVEDIKQTQQGYVTLLDQFFFMVWIMVAMVILVGFAIVYNSSVISLSERERELASLRVLGMDLREVQEVISFEQHFLAAFGMVLGVPLTYMMFKVMADGMQTDLYAIPFIINPRMFIYALMGTTGSLALAYLNVRKRLHKLDMVEVLKSRE